MKVFIGHCLSEWEWVQFHSTIEASFLKTKENVNLYQSVQLDRNRVFNPIKCRIEEESLK